MRRKAMVVGAVRGGWVPIEEVCETYRISAGSATSIGMVYPGYAPPGFRFTAMPIKNATTRSMIELSADGMAVTTAVSFLAIVVAVRWYWR